MLTLDDQTGMLSLCLRNGAYGGKSISLDTRFCGDPLCRCEIILFQCIASYGDDPASLLPMEFSLDLAKKKLHQYSKQVLSPNTLRLCEDMIAEMSRQDWVLLGGILRDAKAEITKEADYTRLNVIFPEDVIIDPTCLVSAQDILPWIRPFIFLRGEDIWIMLDLYCCNPECNCDEVAVTFKHIAVQPGKPATIIQTMPDAQVNTRTGVIEPIEPPWKSEPALETLFHALLEAYPDAVDELDERHRNLRLLFKRSLKNMAWPYSNVLPLKVGPNDPCPCGSKKKYKKCCGRNG